MAAGLPRETASRQAAGHLASSGERYRLERHIQGVRGDRGSMKPPAGVRLPQDAVRNRGQWQR